MDHDFIESMNEMCKKINAKEKLIGWYHSGPKLRASDLEINEVVKRYVSLGVIAYERMERVGAERMRNVSARNR